MAQGITINKTFTGGLKSITFDWKKYGAELLEFFQDKGISVDIKEKPNRATQRAIQSAMQGKGVVKFDSMNDFAKAMHEL